MSLAHKTHFKNYHRIIIELSSNYHRNHFALQIVLLHNYPAVQSLLSNDILVYESEKIIIFYRLDKPYSC